MNRKTIGSLLIGLLLLTENIHAQTLTLRELQQAFNHEDKANVTILQRKGFIPMPVVGKAGMESYGFINKKDERIVVSYLTGYEAEGGQHVVLDYSLISLQAYRQLIASAKARHFLYDANSKCYTLRNGTYAYQQIEPLGKSGRYYHIRYTSHAGKETGRVPVAMTQPRPAADPMIAKGLYEHMADSLKYTAGIPATGNCDTSDIFWRVVKLKDKAIPGLLLNLEDTTETKVAINMQEWYTVADIAYIALREIIDTLPVPVLTGAEPPITEDSGYNSYRQYPGIHPARRKMLKKAVTEWYYSHKQNLVWKDNDTLFMPGCQEKHPNRGRYRLMESK